MPQIVFNIYKNHSGSFLLLYSFSSARPEAAHIGP